MDPGFIADLVPDFKNPDQDQSINKPMRSNLNDVFDKVLEESDQKRQC